MSKIARLRFAGLFALLALPFLTLPSAAAQAQRPARPKTQSGFARAVAITAQKGIHAKLPPHIATMLGLSKEAETPVLQGVVRTGSRVQGIEVSVENENDVILFVVDETNNDQDFYLTSPEGALRKVVSVKAGVGSEVRITDKERKAFEKEKQFWVAKLVPPAPAK